MSPVPAPVLRRLLPALQGLSLASLAVAAAMTVVDAQAPRWAVTAIAVLNTVAIPTIGALWIARHRTASPRRRAQFSILAIIVLFPVILPGSLGFHVPALLLAVALLVVDVGRRAASLAVLALTLAVIGLHLGAGLGWLPGLLNAVPVLVLLGFGIALGSALRAYEEALARDRRTIAERDSALARLEDALVRLRRSADLEKELLLADERARSARDLHDGLGHRLTLISLSLEFARRARDSSPQEAWEEVATADATAREALSEMRTWVRALSPVRDADARGAAAFDAIAESFRGTGLEVGVSAEDLDLSEEASLLLYRAVQEGLTNALRHGRARHADITLATREDQVVLQIRSDLDPVARDQVPLGELSPGFGLRGLTDRASALGGGAGARRDRDEVELSLRLPREAATADHSPSVEAPS